jgi:AAA15 family ATPase/GTPase
MDEFDINFHPHILPLLIGIFDDKKLNKNNAQMLFTTHNTDIMDLIGKYRIVLINQKESESYGYRLDEISGDLLRNDRPITPGYRSGKLGGVPRV